MSTQPVRNDQLLPQNVEAEQAVLGAILVNPESLHDVVEFLSTDDFFITRHAWIWDAIIAIHKRREPLDYLTVSNELKQSDQLKEAGGMGYLLDLIDHTPSALNIEGYGRIVERLAARRRLVLAAGEVARIAHSDDLDIEEVVNKSDHVISQAIDRHVATISKARSVEDVVVDLQIEACQWRDDPRDVRGLSIGLYPFDMATGGLEKGLLYEIAARPGMGKSALVARAIRGLAFAGSCCVLISLEMSDKSMVRRMAVQLSRVDATLLKDGRLPPSDFDRYMGALDEIAQVRHRILIESRAGLTISNMQSIVRRYEREHEVGLVVIDTLNRVHSDGRNPYERMTLISHAVADWAHNATYPILAPIQLRRANQQQTNKRPTLDSFRDSGAIEEDADWIGGLHREYAYATTEEERQKLEFENKEHLAELLVLKNRDGESEKASELYWDARSVNFERLEHRSTDQFIMGRDNE